MTARSLLFGTTFINLHVYIFLLNLCLIALNTFLHTLQSWKIKSVLLSVHLNEVSPVRCDTWQNPQTFTVLIRNEVDWAVGLRKSVFFRNEWLIPCRNIDPPPKNSKMFHYLYISTAWWWFYYINIENFGLRWFWTKLGDYFSLTKSQKCGF